MAEGKQRVMASADTFNPSMKTTLPADQLRCAQYNLMISQLRVALDHRTSKLPHEKMKEILDALDWYHTQSLHATKDINGDPVFLELPVGKWPTIEMSIQHATDKFDRLETITWLNPSCRS